jgi:2-polyprenyl-3-methyl-5-hydroxy-6-metoxy-1,4-benzoquinol methylase
MTEVLKPLARRAVARLAKSGYAVSRTEPRNPSTSGTQFSDVEMDTLSADLDKVFSGGQSFGVWSSKGAVMSYLAPARINFYHNIVAAAGKHGVDLAGKRILDVGTCSGYLLRVVQSRYPDAKLAGSDYYQDCVSLSAALTPAATVFQASIDDLRKTSDTYDVVFCTEVLEHIVDTETQIPALLGLLDSGGALMVTVPNGRFDTTPGHTSDDGVSWVGHVNFWSPQSWQFYISRIAGDYRYETGSIGVHFDGDALYAVIFKD